MEYALYKGDALIIIGTIKEIAEYLEIKEDSVRFYNTPTYKKRTSEKNSRRLIKL